MNNETQAPERVTLSTEVLNGVLKVLAEMPFSQVANVINSIQADAKPVEDKQNGK